jgi:hypothetical protein
VGRKPEPLSSDITKDLLIAELRVNNDKLLMKCKELAMLLDEFGDDRRDTDRKLTALKSATFFLAAGWAGMPVLWALSVTGVIG